MSLEQKRNYVRAARRRLNRQHHGQTQSAQHAADKSEKHLVLSRADSAHQGRNVEQPEKLHHSPHKQQAYACFQREFLARFEIADDYKRDVNHHEKRPHEVGQRILEKPGQRGRNAHCSAESYRVWQQKKLYTHRAEQRGKKNGRRQLEYFFEALFFFHIICISY